MDCSALNNVPPIATIDDNTGSNAAGNNISSCCSLVDWNHLSHHGYVIVEDFLSKSLQEGLQQDVSTLRVSKKFHVADIGNDGKEQEQQEERSFSDVRYSETCFIGRTSSSTPPEKGGEDEDEGLSSRRKLYEILDLLKEELDTSKIVRTGYSTADVASSSLLDRKMEELMYVYYPRGGYYRRHKDAEAGSLSSIRKYSFLFYLNNDWNNDTDGGQLRIHRDAGGDNLPAGELPNFVDVSPQAGTLVLFRSDLCPHEVLDTNRERTAIVGWFLASAASPHQIQQQIQQQQQRTQQQKTNARSIPISIEPNVLHLLQNLRDTNSRLQAKLKPALPQNNTGMLGGGFDDPFGFGNAFPGFDPSPPPPPPPKPEFEDDDPRYWKKVCAFDTAGKVTSLMLNGRLQRNVAILSNALFVNSIVTLDLSNTDLSAPHFCTILEQCNQGSLKQLHLSNNGLGNKGIEQLLLLSSDADDGEEHEKENQPKLPRSYLSRLYKLDLRYNDITGPEGANLLRRFLENRNHAGSLTKLHLEGNQFGTEGTAILSTGFSRSCCDDNGGDGCAYGPFLQEIFVGLGFSKDQILRRQR